jgi:hypothetical protein
MSQEMRACDRNLMKVVCALNVEVESATAGMLSSQILKTLIIYKSLGIVRRTVNLPVI